MKRARGLALAGGIAAAAAHAAPLAQETEPPTLREGALPEVLVSAQRSGSLERLTPVSVGVIGRGEIERKGVADLHDLAGVVAGVVVPNGFSNMPQAVAIRGVGASLPAMSQAVGIYLDDVPLLRGYATALWDLPDIERIEVLRGPQGTLYGQNVSAGAVRFVTRDPQAEPQAWVAGAAGNRGAREARGYASGPVGSGPLLGSLAWSRRSNDGFGWNATRAERINRLDVAQFQAKLRLPVAGRFDAVLALDGALDRSDANTLNYPLNHPDAAPRVSRTSVDSGDFRRNAGGASLRLSAPLGDGLELRSISALRRYHDDPTVTDYGGLEVQRFGLSQQVTQTAASQEVQLQRRGARLDWTAGVMLVRDRFSFDRLSAATPPATGATAYALAQTRLVTTDAGIYAQGRYALDGATAFTAGLRVYRTRQTGSNRFWRATADGAAATAVYAAPDLSTSASGGLPRLALERRVGAGSFVYASVAEGAKFGGFNRAAESLVSARYATDPERVRTWEAGVKSRLAAGRVSVALALFHNDYRNYLAALTNTRIGGVQVNDQVLVNAGAARTWGADLDLAIQLAQRTRWTLSLEGLGSRFDEFVNPAGSASGKVVGNKLPYAPPLSLGTSLLHQQPLAGGDVLALEVSGQYLRSQYGDVANTPALRIPSQAYLNADMSWRSPQRRWTVSLRVKNLGDKAYPVLRNVIAPLGIDAAYWNPPRTWLLSVRHDW